MLISKEKVIEELTSWKRKLGCTPAEEAAEIMIQVVIDHINIVPEEKGEDNSKEAWIPVDDEDHRPKHEQYVLVSFSNFDLPDIARYEENEEGGLYYRGDMEESYASIGLFVNAWQPLLDPYREG